MTSSIIFIFIITSFWEGVGFLLAAKSIFRFGDLKENKEIKLTEYILIGTLISFALAIFIAEIYLKLKSII
ncbi:Ni/Fe-hydrogenase subunit HybB-like protein [Flavobacterium piscis]|uniref:Ni/Fe-hydrogenase subunit HybB-like protein n=1 Tax=Flavobacterium piscis TaxID=1114874 RepID=A0ABU1YFW9_9FLAO|nr:Ni/Fe-hydrogenase subunit HybB-like protein [Flavobacterium piscis]